MMLMMGIGLVVPLLLIGVVAYAFGWRPQFIKTGQTSQEILRARYARGEISREEFDQIRRDLEG